jgi:preprotein translocase subunit SecG
MKNFLILLQIFTAVVVSGLILLQAKGTGLGRTFGQASFHSKRGVEFIVFRLTIIFAVVFILISVANQILS